jgi:hypothetical protein
MVFSMIQPVNGNDAGIGLTPKLSENSVLLIHEADLTNRGKGEFAIDLAVIDGFRIVNDGRQTLLVRGPRGI